MTGAELLADGVGELVVLADGVALPALGVFDGVDAALEVADDALVPAGVADEIGVVVTAVWPAVADEAAVAEADTQSSIGVSAS
jgi:hypothetical protein